MLPTSDVACEPPLARRQVSKSLLQTATRAFQPPSKNAAASIEISDSSQQRRQTVDGWAASAAGKQRLCAWQILYCGGAQPVVDALSEVSEDLGIAFKKEKFDW